MGTPRVPLASDAMLATVSFALAALSAVKAAPVPVVDSSVSLPNTTQVDQTAYWYTQDGRAGACGAYSKDSDVVLGLPLEFYEKYDAVSPYCGSFVVVKGDNNKTVTALVADASTLNDTVTLDLRGPQDHHHQCQAHYHDHHVAVGRAQDHHHHPGPQEDPGGLLVVRLGPVLRPRHLLLAGRCRRLVRQLRLGLGLRCRRQRRSDELGLVRRDRKGDQHGQRQEHHCHCRRHLPWLRLRLA